MKGPGYKQTLDVRRTWRCPACGCERKLLGDVTSLVCDCREGGVFMAIVAERIVAPRPLQILHEHEISSSAFGIEDMPVLAPHPSSLPPERSSPRRPRPGSAEAKSEQQPESESTSSAESPGEPDSLTIKHAEETNDEWGEGIL